MRIFLLSFCFSLLSVFSFSETLHPLTVRSDGRWKEALPTDLLDVNSDGSRISTGLVGLEFLESHARLVYVSSNGPNATVAAGLAAASGLSPAPSSSNPVIVLVTPGVYAEEGLEVPDYVSLVGVGRDACVIRMDATGYDSVSAQTNSLVQVAYNSEIANLTIHNTDATNPSVALALGWNATSGTTTGFTIRAHNLRLLGDNVDTLYTFGANDISINSCYVQSAGADTYSANIASGGFHNISNSYFTSVGSNEVWLTNAGKIMFTGCVFHDQSANDLGMVAFSGVGGNSTEALFYGCQFLSNSEKTPGRVIRSVDGGGTGFSITLFNSVYGSYGYTGADITLKTPQFMGDHKYEFGGNVEFDSTNPTIDIIGGTGASDQTTIAMKETGDANNRFQIVHIPQLTKGPTLEWGDGTSAPDVSLYRPDTPTNTLQLDSDLVTEDLSAGEGEFARAGIVNDPVLTVINNEGGAAGSSSATESRIGLVVEGEVGGEIAGAQIGAKHMGGGAGTGSQMVFRLNDDNTDPGTYNIIATLDTDEMRLIATGLDVEGYVQVNGVPVVDASRNADFTSLDIGSLPVINSSRVLSQLTLDSSAAGMGGDWVFLDVRNAFTDRQDIKGSVPWVEGFDSDVSHGFTGMTGGDATKVWQLGTVSGSDGGVNIKGWNDAGTRAFLFEGHATAASSSDGVVVFRAFKWDGVNNRTSVASGDMAYAFLNGTASYLLSVYGNGDTEVLGDLYPDDDNVDTCGKSGNRWSAVWAANGTIQTSDPSLKEDIENLTAPEATNILRNITPIHFSWIDNSTTFTLGQNVVKTKHLGFDAVELRDFRNGDGPRMRRILSGIIVEPTDGTALGLNYGQLTPILVRGWQRHDGRLDAMQASIVSLEATVSTLQAQIDSLSAQVAAHESGHP